MLQKCCNLLLPFRVDLIVFTFTALDRLGLEDMETLVVSLSPELSRGAIVDHPPCLGTTWARIPQNTAHSLLKIWPVLEEFVETNKIFRLGVRDMPVSEMEVLCTAVKVLFLVSYFSNMSSINMISLFVLTVHLILSQHNRLGK